MKKIILVIVLLVFTMTLCSCNRFISSDKEGDKKCEELLEYLSNDDVEELKRMFCNKTASRSDFDEQIQGAMDFFEGKVISSDRPLVNGGKSVRDGKTTRLDISPHITEIVTDAGKTYKIRFYSYIIHSDDEDMVGISELTIKSEDGEKCVIGVYIE